MLRIAADRAPLCPQSDLLLIRQGHVVRAACMLRLFRGTAKRRRVLTALKDSVRRFGGTVEYLQGCCSAEVLHGAYFRHDVHLPSKHA